MVKHNFYKNEYVCPILMSIRMSANNRYNGNGTVLRQTKAEIGCGFRDKCEQSCKGKYPECNGLKHKVWVLQVNEMGVKRNKFGDDVGDATHNVIVRRIREKGG